MSNRSVAVNLMWCRPGRVGGSEEYLRRQLLGLPDAMYDVTIFAPDGFATAHRDLADRHHVVEMRHDASSRARRIIDESSWLYARTKGLGLVHHGGGTVPVIRRTPIALTIHDLQYLEYPQYFSRLRLEYLRWAMPRAARAADVIAVPTQFVRSTVVDALGVPEDDVVVVPHGIESTMGVGATPETQLREQYGLGDAPIVVFPAITHPHKGHHFLLDVHQKHWSRHGVILVLIGGEGAAESSVRARLADSSLAMGVRRLGRVPPADRDGLMQMAQAVVFPSEYEGFGAPVIEAMALGTPVISSDRACLPEVVGDAGLVVPLDVEAWATALDVVEERRSAFIEAGERRRHLFTTSVSGKALSTVYDRLLG
jgi:glycosyltransferase involved in cell wall biosynthesis